nr:RNA polymerase beta subunit [Scenedesmaceae sp. YH-2023b]
MNNSRIQKNFSFFIQQKFLKKNFCLKSGKIPVNSFGKLKRISPFVSQKKNLVPDPFFFNFSFDKGRLKAVVSWFLEKYGQYKTIQFLEKLKEFGFGYATIGGLSLGIDDLKIPNQKISLISKAETKVSKDLMDYRNAKITGIERMQRLIYTWNQTNDTLKQEVIKYFESTDLFNPIYMMAFSGARGNMSQVRQLVGMRGLMSDPQGQIIDFPIQSNFREGLTLTEYLISTYGARKGIVDTALRTATAGYLTRRLVDVAQHVIVSEFDCGTHRGIFLFDMKETNKTIYAFKNRLVGRVLAQDIVSFNVNQTISEKIQIASRNQEVDSKLALAISKVTKKALVRSPLTCETPRLICQLCYGWSLSQGKLVSVGEAVGVIAAQSIGEPGTQLTMRTFHTGGVFAGGLTDQILAPFDGKIHYVENIPGICIRTSLSEIAFFTKTPGCFFLQKSGGFDFQLNLEREEKGTLDSLLSSTSDFEKNKEKFFQLQKKWKQKNQNSNFSEIYRIPAYAVLFARNNEWVQRKQVLAQFSTVATKQFQYGSAEQTLYSTLAGELYLSGLNLPFLQQNKSGKMNLLVEKRNSDALDLSIVELKNDILWRCQNWSNIWILSGKVFYNSFDTKFFIRQGDCLKKTSVLNRILWRKGRNAQIHFVQKDSLQRKNLGKKFYLAALENQKNSLHFLSNSTKKNFLNCLKNPFCLQKKTRADKFSKNRFFLKKTFPLSLLINRKKENFKDFKNKGLRTIIWHNFFQVETSLKKLDFLPFQPFSSNFSNSYKKQSFKNIKFLKRKKDIISSRNFQKFFIFSFSKEKNIFEKENKKLLQPKVALQEILLKKKKHLKQLFTKFSTFSQKSPFFRVYNFTKIFNFSQKFQKTKYSNSFLFGRQQYLKPKFSILEEFSGKIWHLSHQPFQTTFQLQKKKNPQQSQFLAKGAFHFEKKRKHSFFQSSQKSKLFLFNPPMVKNFKISQTKSYIDSQQYFQNKVFLKKTLFSFQFEKVRYTKFGYIFSFSNFSKNRFFQNSLQTFTTLNPATTNLNQRINPGKQQKENSLGNANFYGKDFPSFLSYCFPKNYQTLTNGIFSIFPFENRFHKQRFNKFLCSKGNFLSASMDRHLQSIHSYEAFLQNKTEYLKQTPFLQFQQKMFQNQQVKNNEFQNQSSSRISTSLFLKNLKVSNNSKKQKEAKKSNSFYSEKKVSFLEIHTFALIKSKETSTLAFSSLDFEKFKMENLLKSNFSQIVKEKNFEVFEKSSINSFLSFQKKKLSTAHFENLFKFSLSSNLNEFKISDNKNLKLTHQNNKFTPNLSVFNNRKRKKQERVLQQKYNFQSFSNSEFYKEEIFWIPQENYTLSLLKISQKEKRNSFKEKKKGYLSEILIQKNPLFYFTNRQGKKKPFFPIFEGIWNWSTFSNPTKFRKLPNFKNRKKRVFQKWSWIQQKFSFYKYPRQKQFRQEGFFSTLKKNQNQTFQKRPANLQKSSLKFVKLKFFLKNSLKQDVIDKKIRFKKNKKRIFLNWSSKVYYAKKFRKNFSLSFAKKFKNQNSKNAKKIFFSKFKNQNSLKKFKIQNEIAKKFENRCFTCLPLQKIDQTEKFSFPMNNSMKPSPLSSKRESTAFLKSEQMHIRIQPGWFYFVPTSSSSFLSHQTIKNPGHFFGKDLCFEQNKILQETLVFNPSLSFSTNKRKDFSTSQNQRVQTLQKNQINQKNKQLSFCLQSFKRNLNCRFLNNGALFAFNNFHIRSENIKFEKINDQNHCFQIKEVHSFENKTIPNFPEQLNILKQKARFACFFRPMHYKLIENSENYKILFQDLTIKNFKMNKSSISNTSSLKIYKNYHSTLLNLQKAIKTVLPPFFNGDLKVSSKFQKLHSFAQVHSLSRKQILFFQTSFRRNQSFSDLNAPKKEIMKKFSIFKEYSKKNLQSKFQNLLIRSNSNNLFQNLKKSNNSNIFVDQSSSSLSQKYLKKQNFQNNYFFSFYPVQFLPLMISNFSFQGLENSPSIPTSFVNSLSNTMDIAICQKKSAFLNQRFISHKFVKNFALTPSFWLQKDNIDFIFFKNPFFNFWKNSFNKKKEFLRSNLQNSKRKESLLKDFLFPKTQIFFANTKLLSPFEGELISMFTNETNWWKKASEISTLQKLDTLFSIVTKKDLFSMNFSIDNQQKSLALKKQALQEQSFDSQKNVHNLEETLSSIPQNSFSSGDSSGEQKDFFMNSSTLNQKTPTIFELDTEHFSKLNANFKLQHFLKTKQKHLLNLYLSVLKFHQNIDFSNSLSMLNENSSEIFSSNDGTNSTNLIPNFIQRKTEISSFVTKYENKIYKFKKLIIGYPKLSKIPTLGKFFVYGDCVLNFAIRKPGQIVHLNSFKVTLRHGQPFLISPKGILHLSNTPYIQKNLPILTLPYQTVQSGDIVQGIPKVEQLFEARTTIQGRLFISSLPILLKGIFERYKSILPLEQAVRQSFLKIQQLIVDGVQRVYRSQGVSIVDKHLEVVVRQMTTKVQIIHGAQTGFFPGELVDLNFVERINKFLIVKIRYEPVILGITRASLEVESFLSASSFQQTTKILALAAISRKKDFLKGLKENILVGNLIPSGTGYMILRKHL